jgi:hypothetical protein
MGLYELPTNSLITTDDQRTHKSILVLINAHQENNYPAEAIKTRRGVKFREIITELFPINSRTKGVESALLGTWIKYK